MQSPITERALLGRINRKLAHDHKKMRKCRYGTMAYSNLGTWHVIDTYQNSLVDSKVDLETFARDLGVMAEWEVLS